MGHAWCHDVASDAAVRAAEDGRTGPLPTLGEAIASPFAEAAERSSTVSETGDGQSGMRTERVTLEVRHDLDARLSDWIVEVVDESLGLMESVRVVDEPSSDADAEVLRRALATSEIKRLNAEGERDAFCGRVAEAAKLAPDANAGGGLNHAEEEIERLRKEIKRLKEEKAADWKACSESALAASVEINQLRAMVREFVHRS